MLNYNRGRHPTGSTHRNQRVAPALALQFIQRCADQNRTRCTDGVTEGHRAASRVHLVEIELELSGDGEADDAERLVDLELVDVSELDAGPLDGSVVGTSHVLTRR